MVSLLAPPHLSPEQYLTQEETAFTKSEYYNGTLIPMIGGSINHNRIIRNLIRHLDRLLTSPDCDTRLPSPPVTYEVFCNDLRVWIPAHNHYPYPDCLILDQPPEFHGDRTDTILNPRG